MGGALFRTCEAQDSFVSSKKQNTTNLSPATSTQQTSATNNKKPSFLKSSFSSPSYFDLQHPHHFNNLDPLVNKTTKHDRHLASIATLSTNGSLNSFSPNTQPTLRKGRTLSILCSSSSTKEKLEESKFLPDQSTKIGPIPENGCSDPILQPIQIFTFNPNFSSSTENSSNNSNECTKFRIVNLTDSEDTPTEDFVYCTSLKDNNYRTSVSFTNSRTFSVNSFKLLSSTNRQSIGCSGFRNATNNGESETGNNHETRYEEDFDFNSVSTTSTPMSDIDNAENDICNFVPSSSSNSTSSDTPIFEPQSSQELPFFVTNSFDKPSQKYERLSSGKRVPLSKRCSTVSDLNQAILEEEQHIKSVSVTHSLSLKSKLTKLKKEVQTVSQLNHSMIENQSQEKKTPNSKQRRKALTPNPDSKRITMNDEKPMIMSMSMTNLFSKTTCEEKSPTVSTISHPRELFKKRSMFCNSTQNIWNDYWSNLNDQEVEKKSMDLRKSFTLSKSKPSRPTLPSLSKKKDKTLIIDTKTNKITAPLSSNNTKLKEESSQEKFYHNPEILIQIEEPKDSPKVVHSGKTLKQLKKQRLQQLKEKKKSEEMFIESIIEEQLEINNYLKAIYNHEYYDIS